MHLPVLTGEKIHLRALVRTDIPLLARSANDRSVARFIPAILYPYTIDDARRWVNKAQRSARNNTACHFGIERLEQSGIIGVIGLKNLNPSDRNAELEYWLTSKYLGRGYASEALNLIMGFAFRILRLHRLYAVTVSSNKPSARLLERHGFTLEGTWRQATRMNRRWQDVYAYGLLRSETRF